MSPDAHLLSLKTLFDPGSAADFGAPSTSASATSASAPGSPAASWSSSAARPRTPTPS